VSRPKVGRGRGNALTRCEEGSDGFGVRGEGCDPLVGDDFHVGLVEHDSFLEKGRGHKKRRERRVGSEAMDQAEQEGSEKVESVPAGKGSHRGTMHYT
jgi:hypothetical protein